MIKFNLTGIQAIAILVPVIAATIGGGHYLLDWYQQPDLADGKYYESAWFEYGKAENILNIIYTPDGIGFRMFLAVHEVIDRVEHKAWINPGIDSKPIRVNIYIPCGADFVEAGSVVISGKMMHHTHTATHQERIEDMRQIFAYSNLNKLKNINKLTVIYRNGTVGEMDAGKYYKHWLNESAIVNVYSNETLQYMIDDL